MAGDLDERIDGRPDLTPEERRALRVLLRDERRARLAWRVARRIAVAVGVSAGATLLGLGTRDAAERFAPTLGLVPLVIETGPDAAERLAASVQQAPIPRGVAIPAGGAAAFHPDGSLEPLASTLEEIVSEEGGGLRRAHLLPPTEGGGDERPVH